jgi:hypothetical protein
MSSLFLKSIVIQDAFENSRRALGTRTAFFYCSRNSAESHRALPKIVLASIVRQLFYLDPGHPILNLTIDTYQAKKVDYRPPPSL